ncbi:SIR2 family protein [Enhygromyxa salina]|uniref:Uncharacterized protein n=1 Tax=Enhygromyxa salina TaxID=215803 RepID=A0A2S9YN86_9BACT|nr:SIR2 family protein [Enhygromyxa salina]PRQ06554.1 hypothetical protein ENSA7_38740 [Enhygromyxa salina]
MTEPLDVPKELSEAIRAGRCVAFVGAGLVTPAVPSWRQLLEHLVHSIDDGHPDKLEIANWLKSDTKHSRDYEGIAEVIKAALGDRFMRELEAHMRVREHDIPATVRRRLAFLEEVPFRAVLTTNFDELIEGELPGPKVYAQVLNDRNRGWWDGGRAPCIKLHGKLDDSDSLVFTTRAYRKRLYQNPSYLAFLRALFATHSVLFLGFSFTDAYFNELRSEVLAMLGLRGAREHLGHDFAVMNDVPAVARRHYADNEGLEILSYSTEHDGHVGFDHWLEAIRSAASPEVVLQKLTENKRILWLDPTPENNTKGVALSHVVDLVDTPHAALDELRRVNVGPGLGQGHGRYDLIITCFMWQPSGPSYCEQLLLGMRKDDIRAPVIVFASGDHREENRARALELGALAFTHDWAELFQTMEAHLADHAGQRG